MNNDPLKQDAQLEELKNRLAEIDRADRKAMMEFQKNNERDVQLSKAMSMLDKCLSALEDCRTEERSPENRQIAICITELEKVYAYWRTFVVGK